MVGWYRRLNGHEFEQTLGDGEGQGAAAWPPADPPTLCVCVGVSHRGSPASKSLVSGVEAARPWRKLGSMDPFSAWITARKLLLPPKDKIPSRPLQRAHG